MIKALEEIENELLSKNVVIDDDVTVEAINNTVILVLSAEELTTLGRSYLSEFLDKLKHKNVEKWKDCDCIFYCWYDDMARQLRLCTISKKHGLPPFKCQLRKRASISDIVEIAYLYLNEDYFNPDINTLDIYIDNS